MDELRSWLLLSRIPFLHAGTLVPLLEHFESVSHLLRATPQSLTELDASPRLVGLLTSLRNQSVERELKWLEQPDCHVVHYFDPRYPTLLREVNDAPLVLYVRGDATHLHAPQVAIVGSRNPTPTGRELAYQFAGSLVGAGVAITSGLALGIDAQAHRGALDAGGVTIAVCGTGVDVIYPRSHRELANRIVESGALVSEFPLGTAGVRTNFPRRNRIISGLSLGTLVVEAALKSGSLITARTAASQGREVFAVPGSVRNPLARGCHELLRQGATLVEAPEDIVRELGSVAATLTVRGQFAAAPQSAAAVRPLDKDYEILLDALGFEPASVDTLIARTGLKSGDVASMLLLLELDGHVQPQAGGMYVRACPEAAK